MERIYSSWEEAMQAHYDRLEHEYEETLVEDWEDWEEEDADELYEEEYDPMTKYDRWRDEQKDKECGGK